MSILCKPSQYFMFVGGIVFLMQLLKMMQTTASIQKEIPMIVFQILFIVFFVIMLNSLCSSGFEFLSWIIFIFGCFFAIVNIISPMTFQLNFFVNDVKQTPNYSSSTSIGSSPKDLSSSLLSSINKMLSPLSPSKSKAKSLSRLSSSEYKNSVEAPSIVKDISKSFKSIVNSVMPSSSTSSQSSTKLNSKEKMRLMMREDSHNRKMKSLMDKIEKEKKDFSSKKKKLGTYDMFSGERIF